MIPSFSIAIYCLLILSLAKKMDNLSLLHSLFIHIHPISPGSWHLFDLGCSSLLLSWFCYILLSLFVMGSVEVLLLCTAAPLRGLFWKECLESGVAAPAWTPCLGEHCTDFGSSCRWVWRFLWGEWGPEGMHRSRGEQVEWTELPATQTIWKLYGKKDLPTGEGCVGRALHINCSYFCSVSPCCFFIFPLLC